MKRIDLEHRDKETQVAIRVVFDGKGGRINQAILREDNDKRALIAFGFFSKEDAQFFIDNYYGDIVNFHDAMPHKDMDWVLYSRDEIRDYSRKRIGWYKSTSREVTVSTSTY